jgi:DNA-binding NarL/FixJ family response regulator
MKVSEKQQQVLVADSQFLITESLRYILKRKGQFIVKKVVTEKYELVKTLKKDDISLLIIDHYQIDFEGVSELKEIITSFPLLKILVITNALSKAELLE